MSRPIYENEQTIWNEVEAKTRIEREFGWKLEKLPRGMVIDFMAFNTGKAVAFVEFKQRNFNRLKYPSYLIALSKVAHGQIMARFTGLHFYLFVQWEDTMGYVQLHERGGWHIGMGGREDRGDPADREPCYFIPIKEFTLL